MIEPYKHLIIICCHGIWLGGPSLGTIESEWLIAPFQHGETPTFTQHIQAGLSLLSSNPEALLILSGGPTRPETCLSEAESYLNLAQVHDYWELLSSPDLKERIILETRALDSFHNILFSITKFWAKTRFWPSHMTIISNEFKRHRILDLHCASLNWPLGMVTFVGLDPDYMGVDWERTVSVMEGEKRNGYGLWEKDPLGVGIELEAKRERRNPWNIDQRLFEDQQARDESGILYVTSSHREVLAIDPQPWQRLV